MTASFSTGEAPLQIVDVHTQVVSRDADRFPHAPIEGIHREWPLDHSVSIEELITYLDGAGVAQAVLVQSSTAYGYDNSYVADCVSRFPDRVVGMCCIDGGAPNASDRLRYWVEERGMAGVRFVLTPANAWIERPESAQVWREAARLEVPVALAGRRLDLAAVGRVLEEYPDARLLLDQMANPDASGAAFYAAADPLFTLATFPNVYLKFTSVNVRKLRDQGVDADVFLRTVIQHFGARRVLWGSNFPSSFAVSGDQPYRDLLEQALSIVGGMSPEDRRWIMGETARSVFAGLGGRVLMSRK